MLEPGVVGVPDRGRSVHPTGVFSELVATPVGDVEWRVGQNVVSLQVRVEIVVEAVTPPRSEVGLDAPDGQVHFPKAPGCVV